LRSQPSGAKFRRASWDGFDAQETSCELNTIKRQGDANGNGPTATGATAFANGNTATGQALGLSGSARMNSVRQLLALGRRNVAIAQRT
jgi:hypothetical protein